MADKQKRIRTTRVSGKTAKITAAVERMLPLMKSKKFTDTVRAFADVEKVDANELAAALQDKGVVFYMYTGVSRAACEWDVNGDIYAELER